jgi:tyrosine-protein kinase Etk/Wzc
VRPVNLLDLFGFLTRHGRVLLLWALGLGAVAYGVSYLIPPQYKAVAVILPPEEDELASALSASRRNLSALGGLGKLSGQYFTQADIALATLRSRTVHERVAKNLDLMKAYDKKNLEETVLALRDAVSSRIASDGTISVAALDGDRERAADIANGFLSELDRSTREFRSSRARRAREFLTRRVAQADSLLRLSERQLAAYQSRRGAVVLTPEARGSVDAAAGLMAQKVAAEVELSILAGYADERSEEYRRLQTRVRELSRQIGQLPATQVGGAELVREVQLQQQMLAVLATYLEESRLREVMDTPTIQVLDPAVPPERRTWPRRSLIALFGFALGAGIGVVRARGFRPASASQV